MDASISNLNFNSAEYVPGYEDRAAFTINSSAVKYRIGIIFRSRIYL